MTLEYRERQALGTGWFIEVRLGEVPVGRIARNRYNGKYIYFKGAHNTTTPSGEDHDLEKLKERIGNV